MTVNFNNKTLRVVSNTGQEAGINEDTVYQFEQSEGVISADYAGGNIKLGKLVGMVHDGIMRHSFVHVTADGSMTRGHASNEVRISASGKILVQSSWENEDKRDSGVCSMEEV